MPCHSRQKPKRKLQLKSKPNSLPSAGTNPDITFVAVQTLPVDHPVLLVRCTLSLSETEDFKLLLQASVFVFTPVAFLISLENGNSL
jgi:hypothetical protein